jgi:predicted phage replisome organizer
MSEKRYYWLKLADDFFTSKRIKKLRSLAGGDTYTIIYLKMQLKALKTEGYLYFDGIMENFAEELALDIDESPENVKVTIQYLLSVGLMECSEDGNEFCLPYTQKLIGSETASTQRVRDYRARKKEQKSLHCNADETKVKRLGNVDIDIEIDKDIDKEKDKKESRNFVPPSLSEVKAYCQERNNGINPQHFIDFYASKGWMIGKNKMKDWKAAVRTWEQRHEGGKVNDENAKPEWHGIFE